MRFGLIPPTRTLIGGILTIAIGLIYLYFSLQIRATSLADSIGPAGMPKAFALLMIGLGIALVVEGLLVRPEPAPDPDRSEDRRRIRRAAGLLAIGIGYLVIVPYAGYVVSIALLIVAVAAYQGAPASFRLALIGIGGALALWVTFVWLLGIPMPAGLFGAMV